MANTDIITFMGDRRPVIQGRSIQCMYTVASYAIPNVMMK